MHARVPALRVLAGLATALALFLAPVAAVRADPPGQPAGVMADHHAFGSGTPRALIRKQLERLPLVPKVTRRRALAVITDYADTRLEDWNGPGFNSTPEVRRTLDQMEAHWEWLSHGKENMDWDIIRVTLPVNRSAGAYAGWPEFRDAVATLIRQQVDVSRYDANDDGVIDSAWVIVANQDSGFDYLIGGASSHAGVNLFVDGQASLSVVVNAYGNFNHELGHTLGLPDLYGPYDTVHYLTLMSDSWPVPPNDFTAYERSLMGWLTPRTLAPGRHTVTLRNASRHFDAVRIPTGREGEYFLIEYRKRPDSGFGSSAPFHNGLAVYHVLENSSQWIDPPLLKLVPADGRIAAGDAPQLTDFAYPGNPDQQQPLLLRSHFGGVPVAALEDLRWEGEALRFDIKVLPPLPDALTHLVLRNRLQNPSFEAGKRLPEAWTPESFTPDALFARVGFIADAGRHSARITSPTPNDARWIQSPANLVPGQAYQFCGSLRGRDIETHPTALVGANVSVMGGFERSRSLAGDFDWTPACVVFQPQGTSVTLACRLGFHGSVVSGRLWCDRMTLYPLRSAFGPPD